MSDVPKEIEAILRDRQLQEAVEKLPGSRRFKAMALGLSVLRDINRSNRPEPEGDGTDTNR